MADTAAIARMPSTVRVSKSPATALLRQPSGGTPAATVYYRQRAYQISTGSLVFWEYTGPDPTGAHSGIDPVDLRDIVLLGTR